MWVYVGWKTWYTVGAQQWTCLARGLLILWGHFKVSVLCTSRGTPARLFCRHQDKVSLTRPAPPRRPPQPGISNNDNHRKMTRARPGDRHHGNVAPRGICARPGAWSPPRHGPTPAP